MHMHSSVITLRPPSVYNNKFAQKQNQKVSTTNVVVWKAPIYYIPKHSMISDIMGKAVDLSNIDKDQIVISRQIETLHLMRMQSLWASIESGVWTVKQHVSDQRFVASGVFIPEDSDDRYALFAGFEELQKPKSPTATTVAIRTVFLSTQCSVHYCVWAYTA